MRPPAGSARRWAATCSFSRRSSASASNSSLRARRYSLDSPGKWTFGSRSTSRHLFMSRGLPLRAIVSILSYAPNSLPCGVGNSERLFIYCGFLWGNPLSRRTSRRAEPRYIGLRVSEFWRQALAVPSVWSLSGQGPEPFPHPGRELQAQTRGEQRPALGGASGNGFEIGGRRGPPPPGETPEPGQRPAAL